MFKRKQYEWTKGRTDQLAEDCFNWLGNGKLYDPKDGKYTNGKFISNEYLKNKSKINSKN